MIYLGRSSEFGISHVIPLIVNAKELLLCKAENNLLFCVLDETINELPKPVCKALCFLKNDFHKKKDINSKESNLVISSARLSTILFCKSYNLSSIELCCKRTNTKFSFKNTILHYTQIPSEVKSKNSKCPSSIEVHSIPIILRGDVIFIEEEALALV
jgi:hypothetical protein